MKKALLLVFPLLLSGCIDDVARAGLAVHEAHEERNNNPTTYMTYFQDKNTKLCFASLDMPSITQVPCTEEVLKVIKDKEQLTNNKNSTSNNQQGQNLSDIVAKHM